MKHRQRLGFLALVGMLVLTACGGPGGSAAAHGDSTGVTPATILLGGTDPLSGPVSAYATISKASQAYFQYVNDQGGINGRKIDFRVVDDAYSPPRTVQLTRQLVQQDKVFALFGSLGTQAQTSVRQYLNDHRVPQLFVSSGSITWGLDHRRYPWSIGWVPVFQTESIIYGRYVRQNLPAAKIGVLLQNDDFGQDYLTGLVRGLGDRAAQIVDKEPYDVTAADVTSQMARLRGSGADTLFVFATPKFAIDALVTAFKLGWHPKIFLGHAASSSSTFLGAANREAGSPDATDGVISVSFLVDPGNARFDSTPGIKLYRQIMDKYLPGADQKDATYLEGMALGYTMVDVLKQTGRDLTRERLMQVVENITETDNPFVLPGVTVRTTPSDHFPVTQMAVGEVHNGIFDPSGALQDTRSDLRKLAGS